MGWKARAIFVTLLLAGCGDDSGEIKVQGVTAECTLAPIARARLAHSGVVDCSPAEAYSESAILLQYSMMFDDSAEIQCMNQARAARRAFVHLTPLFYGTDSRFQYAMFVAANGGVTMFSYDSSPFGMGSGANTIYVYPCGKYPEGPDAGCGDADAQLVCSQSDEIWQEYRAAHP